MKGGSVPQSPGRKRGRSKVENDLEKAELPSDCTEKEKKQFVQHGDPQVDKSEV